MQNNVIYESPENKQSITFTQELPATLSSLSSHSHTFNELVTSLESTYITAQKSNLDKSSIEKEAKDVILKGLKSVVQDIHNASSHLDLLISLQSDTLDSLTSQINLIQTRLTSSKDQHLLFSLEDMKSNYFNDENAEIDSTDFDKHTHWITEQPKFQPIETMVDISQQKRRITLSERLMKVKTNNKDATVLTSYQI
eukprot:gene17015-23386_t